MKDVSLHQYVTRLLLLLDFATSNCGFRYLREMILMTYDNDFYKLSQMYQVIAKQINQPAEAIQTAVRNVIKNAYAQSGFKPLEQMMGAKLFDPRYTVSIREFVAIIKEYLLTFWDGTPTFPGEIIAI